MSPKQAPFFLRAPYLLVGSWALAILSMAMSLVIFFHAGCTGDVKTLALGDVRRALQLENYAILMAMLSVILSAVAFCQTSKSGQRTVLAGALVLFLFLSLWVVGVQVEAQGVRSCFS